MLLGYCRVSTSEQAADGTTSLAEQERIIRGMAMARGFGAFETQVYVDAGVSGSIHMKWRPAGRDLLEAVKPGDTVAAAKLDRMFRNSLDALKIYTDFKERGIHLVLFDLGVEPITNDSGMSKVIFQVMSAFADHERETIRARMLDGKEAKRRRGGHTGGEAPYGFRIVGESREARLEEVPEEQEVIAMIGRYHYTPYEICRRLTARGVLTRAGKPFHMTQVMRIQQRLKKTQQAEHAVH